MDANSAINFATRTEQVSEPPLPLVDEQRAAEGNKVAADRANTGKFERVEQRLLHALILKNADEVPQADAMIVCRDAVPVCKGDVDAAQKWDQD